MTDQPDTQQTTIAFSADQLDALAALLHLVHYDNLAQDWFNLLPEEVRKALRSC